MDAEFAVIDLETTGLYPGRHDRVIEIGIVRLDQKGEVLFEYETLVNPNRDLGPTWLHGIKARDLREAPEFSSVSGDVVRSIRDSILVGHNVEFDTRFIEAEFERASYRIPSPPRLDTIFLASRAHPGLPNRKLGDVCRCFGIEVGQMHSALSDARATARLFLECLDRLKSDGTIVEAQRRYDASEPWPTIPSEAAPYPRSRAVARSKRDESYISSLIGRLSPSAEDPAEVHSYFSLLDQILEDRRISEDEADALYEMATMLGMSAEAMVAANTRYLHALVEVALRDGILSAHEKRDLKEVAGLLELSSALPGLIREIREGSPGHQLSGLETVPDLEGASVCFTGSLRATVDGKRASRNLASRIAASQGMIVKKGVTKKLDFLVVADPDSMSGKASKARRYGTRIVAEPVFWRWMGMDVQ